MTRQEQAHTPLPDDLHLIAVNVLRRLGGRFGDDCECDECHDEIEEDAEDMTP